MKVSNWSLSKQGLAQNLPDGMSLMICVNTIFQFHLQAFTLAFVSKQALKIWEKAKFFIKSDMFRSSNYTLYSASLSLFFEYLFRHEKHLITYMYVALVL